MRSTSQGSVSAGLTDKQALGTLPRLQDHIAWLIERLDSNALRAIVQGPDPQLVEWVLSELQTTGGREANVACISGARKSRVASLNSALAQFGYDFASKSVNELLGMLRVFAVHQTDTGLRPLLIVRDAERLKPSILEILQEINGFQANRKPALNIALFGSQRLSDELRVARFAGLADFEQQRIDVATLSAAEVVRYIKARINLTVRDLALLERLLQTTDGRAARIDRLLSQSRQWPDLEPEAALGQALDSAGGSSSALADESVDARLLISQNGRLLDERHVNRKRIMVGRADHNDLVLDSRYISRYHALIIEGPEDAHWIVDLNSRNGTFVNSRAVDYLALRDNDVIALGNHRVKYVNPEARSKRPERNAFAGSATAVFETLKADGGPDLTVMTQNLRQPS